MPLPQDCLATALADAGVPDDEIEDDVAQIVAEVSFIRSNRVEIDGCVPSLAFRLDASNLPCYADSLSAGLWERMPT
eukprot:SAG31_NODE_3211_length_4548_cov_3.394695_4_plen_77_part_00